MITVDKYNTIRLNHYNGTVSLELGWQNRDGEFKVNFCDREFGKGKEKKTVPIRIPIGTNTAEAIINLQAMIEELGGGTPPF